MMVSQRSRGSALVADLRKTKGFTQKRMADWLGVSQSCLSDWEGGRRKPGLELGTRIAKLTKGKVPVASWFELLATTPEERAA